MRWSELIGLRRSKVDLRGRKIRVTEQLVQMEDGSFVRKEPKTGASVRAISLSEAMTALLVEHTREFSAAGPDALVFSNGAGNPISSSSFLTHHFRRAQAATGVSCRFHDYADVRVMPTSARARCSAWVNGLELSA
jgi:integrase